MVGGKLAKTCHAPLLININRSECFFFYFSLFFFIFLFWRSECGMIGLGIITVIVYQSRNSFNLFF